MDKPQKDPTTPIGTSAPKSKFEDSPVFNYMNNLSPLEPVKSISTALSSICPSPVFITPKVDSQSRFFRNYTSVDRSKPLESLDGSAIDDLNRETSISSPKMLQLLNFDSQTPDHSNSPCSEYVVTENPSDPSRGDSGLSPEDVKMGPQKMLAFQVENGTPDCGRSISDATELLVFRSPNDSVAVRFGVDKLSNSEIRFCTGNKPTKQPDISKDIPANGSSNESEPLAVLPNNSVFNLHGGGMLRRRLDFEMPGKRKEDKADDQQSVCDNKAAGESSSRCVVPGIGLHLNAVAMSSMDANINVIHDYPICGEIQRSFSGSTTPVHSQDTVLETLDQAESVLVEGQAVEEVPNALTSKELNPGSLKNKMRMSEQAEEDDSCNRCNCKKSKCLKLYCECFAAGVYCIEPCSCVDCFNKPIYEDTVLATSKQIESRNPLAFAGEDASTTPASARHKRCCNCKKSNCLKYCECFQGGVGCSLNCGCEGCENAFGRKEGSLLGFMESIQEEDQETYEKITAKIHHNFEMSKETEQNPSPDKYLTQSQNEKKPS